MTNVEMDLNDSEEPEETLAALENGEKPKGIKIPKQGWGRALTLAAILCIIGAVYLSMTHDKSIPPEKTETEKELESMRTGDTEGGIILSEGSSVAPEEDDTIEAPGGLMWEELLYPEAERLLTYMGKELVEGERAYVSADSYDDVKKFYSDLIEEKFFMIPEGAEFTEGDGVIVIMKNKTGSLTVRLDKYSYDEKVHILVTRLKNLAAGNLKSFGGPGVEGGEE